MDNSRFDDLAKLLGRQPSRRRLLGALAGTALASLGLGRQADARACRAAGNSCSTNSDCCSNACVNESRTRNICHCTSPADCPPGDQCHPAICSAGACSTPVQINLSCDDGNACTTNDRCQSNGACSGIPVVCPAAANECFTAGTCQKASGQCSDQVYRGDGAVCSNGVCFQQACCVSESADVTCSGGKCGPQTNNCGRTVQCLAQAGGGCTQDDQCCSGICVTDANGQNGSCQTGPVAAGGACDSNGDCASQTCCTGICRDLTSDPDHCGGCDATCSSTNMANRTCSDGVCEGSCAGVTADCNHDLRTDGCETNLASDPDNCGACGHVCPSLNMANRPCFAQVCVGSCAPGFANCTHDTETQGCPVDLTTDPNNCGACGLACTSGQFCAGGTCAALFANGGACATDGNCQSGHCCGGVCRTLDGDPDNCGICGNACTTNDPNATSTCTGGTCGIACADGFTVCGNACIDIQNDAINCGSCGHVCSFPNAAAGCEYGGCVVDQCNSGFASCGGLCNVNITTDPNNCGSCGHACDAGAVCHNGTCCTPDCTTCINVIGQPVQCQYAPGSCNFDDSCGGLCNDCPECTACDMVPGADFGFCATAPAKGDHCETNSQCIGDACCLNNMCVICDFGVQNGTCAPPPVVGGPCGGGHICATVLDAICCYDTYCHTSSGVPRCCPNLIGSSC